MKSLKLILIFTSVFAYSQSNIFDRLSVLDNNGKTWYNIDGYSVTSEVFNNSFDEKDFALAKVKKVGSPNEKGCP